jgi:hypothetical protein
MKRRLAVIVYGPDEDPDSEDLAGNLVEPELEDLLRYVKREPELAAALAPDHDLVERLQGQLQLVIAQIDEARDQVAAGQTEQALELLDEIVDAERCRSCGCTHTSPCDPPCSWAEAELCTACVPS